MQSGIPEQLCPDDHVTLLKRDSASDSRPNIGFRIIMALQKPKLEDHYTLLKGGILGTGTFGAVHKAKNLKTNEIVAVKIIRSLRGSNLSQDLEREIRIMKKLDHVCSPFIWELTFSQILFSFMIHLRKLRNMLSLVTLLWNSWKAGLSTIVFRLLHRCQKPPFNTSFVKS